MLKITLSENEEKLIDLQLEHSLVSLSKWESVYEKPFFGRDEKTPEEMESYIRMMVVGGEAPENLVSLLDRDHVDTISSYINSKQTATFFSDNGPRRGSSEIVTTELVYYWMKSFKIPFWPCETWHFNRLMTLIQICGVKETKPKKMSQSEIMERNRRLNEERRKQMGSQG